MCDCAAKYTDEDRYGVIPGTECSSISIDILKMYKRPIDCYIQYDLYGQIGSSSVELINASQFLQTLINQKTIDINNCDGIESLSIIRALVDKIIKKGMCL